MKSPRPCGAVAPMDVVSKCKDKSPDLSSSVGCTTVNRTYDKYALLDGENQKKMLIERLKNWLEQRAYSNIVSTINTLDEDSEQKVLGFIHLYDYILKSTDDDYELIDQLFFIPGRFEREFRQRK